MKKVLITIIAPMLFVSCSSFDGTIEDNKVDIKVLKESNDILYKRSIQLQEKVELLEVKVDDLEHTISEMK